MMDVHDIHEVLLCISLSTKLARLMTYCVSTVHHIVHPQ